MTLTHSQNIGGDIIGWNFSFGASDSIYGLLIVSYWLHKYVVFVLGLICLTAVFRFLLFLF